MPANTSKAFPHSSRKATASDRRLVQVNEAAADRGVDENAVSELGKHFVADFHIRPRRYRSTRTSASRRAPSVRAVEGCTSTARRAQDLQRYSASDERGSRGDRRSASTTA